MKNYFAFSITLALFATLSAFQAKENQVKYYYNETACANHWPTSYQLSIEEVEFNVKKFLLEREIMVDSVKITRNIPEGSHLKKGDFIFICESCGCLTGRFVELLANQSDSSSLARWGFYQLKK